MSISKITNSGVSNITLDSTNNRVGINQAAPAHPLHVGTDDLILDASGNLLVGTTSTGPGLGNTNTGIQFQQSGVGLLSMSNEPTLYVNRNGTDGPIAQFSKDGTAVGRIAVSSGNNLQILGTATDHVGLEFGTNEIIPKSNGANTDGTINLGVNTVRFKDLYLSGGVYLGGTGSANYLDDYEEGSWTPGMTFGGTVATLSEANGAYTKVGRMVTLNGHIAINTLNGGSGAAYFTGLPFSVDNTVGNTSVEASGHVSYFGSMTTTVGTPTFGAIQGTTTAEIYNGLHSTTLSQLTSGYVGNGTNMRFSITYFTT